MRCFMTANLKILYLDSERSWRGGQNQVFLLVRELCASNAITPHFALDERADFAERLAMFGPIVRVNYRSGFNFFAAFGLARYCKKNSITIVHAQSSKGHWLGLWIKFFAKGLRLIVHRRVDNIPKNTWFQRRKYLTPAVEVYVAISEKIREVLIAYGVNPDRIRLARSAVDSVSIAAQQNAMHESRHAKRADFARQIFGDGPRSVLVQSQTWVVIVGAMSEQKGHRHLFDALSILQKNFAAFHCFVLGEGALEKQLREQIERLDLSASVSFVGFRKDVTQWLSGFDIFAMPSNWEGLGTAILEAMSAGLPVLASKVGGIPEMVIDHQTGLLTEPGNPKSIATGLEELCRNAAMRVSLAEAAKDRILPVFSVAEMAKINLEIYQRPIN
jgi:glycosyltransferase involved in cell wall biosynthesis